MTVQRYIAHGLVEVEGRYLFLQRGDGRYLGGCWDIPGGTVEEGESPESAVVRECVEEAGIACTVGAEVSHFENMDTGGRDINFHTITYRLHSGQAQPEVIISNEHQSFMWATPEQTTRLDVVWHVRKTIEAMAWAG
ncbi:MAG: NUDIX domain-containing protein [Dermatophilaceae bacterium]